MTTKENKLQDSKVLEQAFIDSLKVLNDSRFFSKKENKNKLYNELCFYALKLKKDYNRAEQFKKLFIDSKLVFLKSYFESVGLFFAYSVKDNFIKVIVDSESIFSTCKDVNDLPKYTDYLKEQLENQPPKKVDYQKRLKTLFKNVDSSEIKKIINNYINTIK